MVNIDKQFIDAIHSKIIAKKRKWTTMFTSAMILMVVFIAYESFNIIQNERYESLWSEYQYEQEEYYLWEVNDELSDDELFSVMLELYHMDEIFDILKDSSELLQVLKTANLEG